MKTLTLAGLLLAAAGSSGALMSPVYAVESTSSLVTSAAETAKVDLSLTALKIDFNLAESIRLNPAGAEELVATAIFEAGSDSMAIASIILTAAESGLDGEAITAAAITAAGPDSPATVATLKGATAAGMDPDTVTTIAIASGVDASTASEATAWGWNSDNISERIQRARERIQRVRERLLARFGHGGGCGGGISPNC